MIRRIQYQAPINNPYLADIERIQRVMEDYGYEGSLRDAESIWDCYSTEMCAGWMMLPEADEELWQIIASDVVSLCAD